MQCLEYIEFVVWCTVEVENAQQAAVTVVVWWCGVRNGWVLLMVRSIH